MPFVRVGTHPTRNFDTLGRFIMLNSLLENPPIIYSTGLTITREIGLYLPQLSDVFQIGITEVWRIVSEDFL